jgi:hypothetical protein
MREDCMFITLLSSSARCRQYVSSKANMTDLDEKNTTFFTPTQEKFLTHKCRDKLLTQFKVGKNQVIIYGSPLIMAQHSTLIDSMLDYIDDSENAVPLMEFMNVEEKSLQFTFLYLHNLDDITYQLSKLTLLEFLNMFDLIKYFGLTMEYDGDGLYSCWLERFKDMINEKNRSELLEHKQRLTNTLNEILKRHTANIHDFYGNIFNEITSLGLTEIIKLIDYLIVLYRFTNNDYYEGIISKEELKTNGLDKSIEQSPFNYTKSEDGEHYISDVDEGFKWELIMDVPGAIVFKDVGILLPESAKKS